MAERSFIIHFKVPVHSCTGPALSMLQYIAIFQIAYSLRELSGDSEKASRVIPNDAAAYSTVQHYVGVKITIISMIEIETTVRSWSLL